MCTGRTHDHIINTEHNFTQGFQLPTYSHSKIECYRSCPRKYYYQYIAKVKLEDTPHQIALFFGSRCHDALEWLYGKVKLGVVPTQKQLIHEYERIWDELWEDSIEIHEPNMTPKRYRTLGGKLVSEYYEAHHPFDDSITIELEQMVRFDLNARKDIRMVGYIDRLAKDPNGVWHIHDYKTNKQLPTQADMDQNPQLAYYEIGIRQMWPKIKEVQLHWHFLRFGETITSTRTKQQLRDLRNDALSTISDITASGKDEEGFETNESGLCPYCDFQEICPVTKHEFRVNGLPLNKYRNDPGVKLVNTWSKLKAQRDSLNDQIAELDSEIAEIQDALIEYAEREDIEIISGDEYEATVRYSEKTRFPTKSNDIEDYTNMERRLQESPYWDMVSGLDRYALATLWKQPEALDPKLRRILKKFALIEQKTKVSIRGKRS